MGGRYAKSRQKACISCSAAKARCDRRPGACSRCATKALQCSYVGADDQTSHFSPDGDGDDSPTTVQDDAYQFSKGGSTPCTEDSSMNPHNPDFSRLSSDSHLICPINAEEIRNRWVSSYIPYPGQKEKHYPEKIAAFIYRTLKSYTSAAFRNRAPPFIHPALSPLPLRQLGQGGKRDIPTLMREADTIYQLHAHEDSDVCATLIAFQGHLVMCMALFFEQGTSTFLRGAVTNLQHLASLSAKALAATWERAGSSACPPQKTPECQWEEWIVAESTRRALFTMYLFDNVLAAHDGIASYLGSELESVLAPSAKNLWQATSRGHWQEIYRDSADIWNGDYLRIEELWPMPDDMDDEARKRRLSRIDRWLEDVDEFGTMIFAVTSCTHGTGE